MKYLIDTIQSNDMKVKPYKRIAIDAVYAIAVHCRAEITHHMD